MRKSKKFILLSGTIGALTTSIIVPTVFIVNNTNKNDYLKKISYAKSIQPFNNSIDNVKEITNWDSIKTIKMFVNKDNIEWKNIISNEKYSKHISETYQTYWDDKLDLVMIDFYNNDSNTIEEMLHDFAKYDFVISIELNQYYVPNKVNIPDFEEVIKFSKHGEDEIFKDVAKRYQDPLSEKHYQILNNVESKKIKIGVIEVDPLNDFNMQNYFKDTVVVNYDVDNSTSFDANNYKNLTHLWDRDQHSTEVSLLAAGEHSLNKNTELHFMNLKYEFSMNTNGSPVVSAKTPLKIMKTIDRMLDNGVRLFNNSYGVNNLDVYEEFIYGLIDEKTFINRIKNINDSGYKYESFLDEYLQNRALHKGAVFVFSSGNDDDFERFVREYINSAYFDKYINNVRKVNEISNFYNISVGAVDSSGVKTSYSSYVNNDAFIDQPLPLVTALGNINKNELITRKLKGTSYSAPIVSNIISYMLENNATIFSSDKFRNQLVKTLLSVSSKEVSDFNKIEHSNLDSSLSSQYIDVKRGNYSDMYGAGEVSISSIFQNIDNVFTKEVNTSKTWYGSRKLLPETEVFRFNKKEDGWSKLKISLAWMPKLKEYKISSMSDVNKNSQKLIDDIDFKIQRFNTTTNKWVDVFDYDIDKLVSSNIEMKYQNIYYKGEYRVMVKEIKRNTTRDGFYIGGAYAFKQI